MTTNQSRRIKSHIFLTFIAAFLSLASFISVTISWFQSARRVPTNMSGIYVTNLFNVSISLKQDGVSVSDGIINFTELYPGTSHTREVEIIITNHSEYSIATKWFFKIPTSAQDVPYIDVGGEYGPEGYYYYLASQIQVSDVYASIGSEVTDTAVGENQFLLETNSSGVTKGQVNGVSAAVGAIPSLLILDEYLIGPDQTATIVFDFTFVDNLTNQNVYQTAWPTVGVCQRHLGLFIEPIVS